MAASAKQKNYQDSVSYYSAQCKTVEKTYKPVFKGWKITHSYKANNGFGIPVIQQTTFYFDIPITKITGPKEITESAR
ncbi:hypothetical protein SAMN05421664_2011 [Chryseobacterium soldanellicola]|uniref:Uncharacterized protein n=1 Tax=Chryseobacterium soldanellicola TaxID=311333 RepID=A0A1H1CKW5_9FLAO|nr:hypothetical protein [Chryseobacterium soldanellicola]SDQ64875.1 hypothetical protein SAMN05421664_2011 [Chryseobacterium soldanellicola]